MQLATTVLIGMLNVFLFIGGLMTSFSKFSEHPRIDTFVTLLIGTMTFGATALFAMGKRSRVIWGVAIVMNALNLVAMLAFVFFLRSQSTSPSEDALLSVFAFSGVFVALNLAYLLWRTPSN